MPAPGDVWTPDQYGKFRDARAAPSYDLLALAREVASEPAFAGPLGGPAASVSTRRYRQPRLAQRAKEVRMKTLTFTLAVGLLILAPTTRAAEQKHKGAAKPHAVSLDADQLQWGDAPPSLPKGAQVAVLHGDPSKKGPFAIRLKMPAGYKIPPHWHTQDENLTIVSGTFVLHMGDAMDAAAHTFTAGGFHFLPGKAHHAAEATDETVVQIHGNGPFDIHYLNPADDPRKTAAAQ